MKLDDVLVITHEHDVNLELASRNLYHIGILEAQEINPLSLIGFNKVLMTSEAIKLIEEKFA
jgi:large subunit ribosomal protein L4